MATLHRRANATKDTGDSITSSQATNEAEITSQHIDGASKRARRKTIGLWGLLFGLHGVIVLATTHFAFSFKTWGQFFAGLILCWVASIPIVLSLGVGLGVLGVTADTDLPHQRYIPLAVVATIIGNQLPSVLSSAMASIALLLFGLSSRPKHSTSSVQDVSNSKGSKSQSGAIRAVLSVFVMITVLLNENFFIWVVSATYKASQDRKNLPTPLQDNGQLILRHLLNEVMEWSKRDIVRLRNKINVEWILVSGMGLSLVAIELQGARMKRNLWGLAMRAVLTLAAARFIRTVSFLITVLPNQNPQCYFGHFPYPPPKDWSTWLMTGFIPQAHGGCNDLIISGHATVTSTLACVVTSVVGKPYFTAAIWLFVAVDYMVEVFEGFHYSVDMWLGAVLVNFIWTTLAFLETNENSQHQQGGSVSNTPAGVTFYKLTDSKVADVMKYAIPVAVAYIQVNGILIPKDSANYTILLFVGAVIVQISTVGFQQYTQHCLFSLLFLALGIYL
eukprot:Nitzschia sp. Nitz4//scaffold397_size11424//7961//9472//NITZ4_009043-RA/size11424-processed-gene-0.26-mRNA-1//1//CDS//3329550290//4373//frame0